MGLFATLRRSYGVKILLVPVMVNTLIFLDLFQYCLSAQAQTASPTYYSPTIPKHREAEPNTKVVQPDTPNIGTIAPSAERSKVTPTSVHYLAKEPFGVIGATGQTPDNPADNFFTVVLPGDMNLADYDVHLKYDLYGLAHANQTTKSINGHPAYGGQTILVNEDWITVEEPLSQAQLRSGVNEIFFNRRNEVAYRYEVKNLSVVLAQKSTAPVTVLQTQLHKGYNKLLASGIVADASIASVTIMDKVFPVEAGLFEGEIDSITEEIQMLEIGYSLNSQVHEIMVPVVQASEDIVYLGTFPLLKKSLLSDETEVGDAAAVSPYSAQITGEVTDKRVHGKHFKDIRLLNADLKNVTGGAYEAYLVDYTAVDSSSAKLHLKYDSSKIPDGYTHRDVRTFYYDKHLRTWKALVPDSLDVQNNEIISRILENETDYINGVIMVPESPEVGSFAPTTISDMKYADPTAGIVGISPPTPSNTGAATTSFPLKLPNGRNGMQPSLAVSYSSEGPNGLMGIGWDLSIPAITLNTKWGAPRFTTGEESEMYLLNGSELLLRHTDGYTNPHRTTDIPRADNRQFYERKEGAFHKIVRYGSNPNNYYWVVTDKQGTKTYYGGVNGVDNNSVIRGTGNNIAHWGIKRVEDAYGNYIEYVYEKEFVTLSNGITAQKFNIKEINYTRHSQVNAYYNVRFHRTTYTLGGGSQPREDALINARNGYLGVVNDYLTEVIISLVQGANTKRVRGYRFDYDEIAFKKRQLTKISEYDAAQNLFYSHTMEYYNDVGTNAIITPSQISWTGEHDEITSALEVLTGANPNLPKGSALGTSVTSGYNFGLRFGGGVGFNASNVRLTLGGGGSYSVNNQDTKATLMDIDGDGLPDKLYRNGGDIYYRKNNGQGFGNLYSIPSLSSLSKNKSRTTGAHVDFNAGFIGIGRSWSKTKSETSNYFMDYNGDGLPDQITPGVVRFNQGPGVTNYFSQSVNTTDNPIQSGAISPDVLADLNLETLDELRDEHPQYDHVKVWKAPYDGTIKIEGWARLLAKNQYGQPIRENKFRVSIEKATAGQTTGAAQQVISPVILQNVNQAENLIVSSTNSHMELSKGDLIFFRIHNLENGYGGEVEWNPTVTYTELTTMEPLTDENGKNNMTYHPGADFLINNGGSVSAAAGTSVKPLFNLPTLPVGFVGNVRFVIKRDTQPTNDEEPNIPSYIQSCTINNGDITGSTFTNWVTVPNNRIYTYHFYAESDSNIDWQAINWQPQIERNGVVESAPVNYRVYDDHLYQNKYWFDASELPVPIINNDGGAAFLKMEHNFPQNFPDIVGGIPEDAFPFKATWMVKVQTPSGTEVRYNKDFWFLKTPTGFSVSPINTGTIPIPLSHRMFSFSKNEIQNIISNNGRIYSAFYLPFKQIGHPTNDAWVTLSLVNTEDPDDYPTFSPAGVNKPFFAHAPEFYGTTFRGWGQFLYNGGLQFARNEEGDIVSSIPPLNFGNSPIDMAALPNSSQAGQLPGENPSPEDVPGNPTSARVTLYAQKQDIFINTAILSGPVKTAEYGFNAANKLSAKLGRFGEYNTYELYVDPAEIALGGSGIFAGLKMRSESKGTATSGNVLGFNGTVSKANTRVLTQFIDLNGDRYPDIVTPQRIQYTRMVGGLSTQIEGNGFATGDESRDRTMGVSIIPPPNSTSFNGGASDGSGSGKNENKTASNASSGINTSEGESFKNHEYTDMNGDGLPDKVIIAEGKVLVQINLGYSFEPEIVWGNAIHPHSSQRSSGSAGGGPGVEVSQNASYAVGVGLAISESSITSMLVDINGDGLPDLVGENGVYMLNSGQGFVPLSNSFYNHNVERDASVSGNIFGAFTYGITVTFPFIVLKFTGTLSAGVNANYNEKERTLVDIDGDGYLDVVSKGNINNNSHLLVRRNITGKTHLLKRVNLALGGNWSIDYARDGNTYDMPQSRWTLSEIRTFDGFTEDNAFNPDHTLVTVSYENPKYDRRERDFLGYKQVFIEEKNPSNQQTYRTSVKTYLNSSIYLSGTLQSSKLLGQNGDLLTETTTLYNLLDPDAPIVNMLAAPGHDYLQMSMIPNKATLLDKSRLFLAPVRITATSYEGSDSLSSIREFVQYGSYGNLEKFIDYGTGPDDAYMTKITYASSSLDYAVGLPNKIFVEKLSNNQLLRFRAAEYNNYGKVGMVSVQLNENEFSTVKISYDAFGNIDHVTELDNLDADNQQSYWRNFRYDPVVATYPITIENAHGEISYHDYEYLFGTNVWTIDSNGQGMRTRIDSRGRLVEITGPNEMALEYQNGNGSAWTIRMQYYKEGDFPVDLFPQTFMIGATESFQPNQSSGHTYAITRHFDPEYAPAGSTQSSNQLLTVSIVDGLGRPIQLKKSNFHAGDMRWIISGFEEKDPFGRVKKSFGFATGAYSTVIGGAPSAANAYVSNPNNLLPPTIYEYDERDRVVSVQQSGATGTAQTEYSIQDGMFVQHTINELSQTATVYTDVRGRQRKTVQNDEITTLFDYDTVNMLVSVTNNAGHITESVYDMAGRKIEARHPDRGVVTFEYDLANRLIRQQNSALLIDQTGPIQYFYDHNRLIRTEYPQNTHNNVTYTYGKAGDTNAMEENAVGRLLYQEDASGMQAFGYGRMGELTKQLRSVAVGGYQSYWFLTKWKYDSWNRLQEIIYPDEERAVYDYDLAGNLRRIRALVPGGEEALIVRELGYTAFGEREFIQYGNGTHTNYAYQPDGRRRLSDLHFQFSDLQLQKQYDYDDLNITGIFTNNPSSSLPVAGGIGGPASHRYEYDNFNRLIQANGTYVGANDQTTPYLHQSYELNMEYNPDHTILKKTQVHYQGTVAAYNDPVEDQYPVFKTSYSLDYSGYGTGAYVASQYGYQQPHAVRKIVESPTGTGSVPSDDPRIRSKNIAYDANGNQSEISETVGDRTIKLRRNLWDEENRLKAVDLKPDEKTMHPIAIYFYDAAGERAIRHNYDRMDISSSAKDVGKASSDNVMIYPNGLIMAKVYAKSDSPKKRVLTYTKNYYIGSERVAAVTDFTKNLGHFPKFSPDIWNFDIDMLRDSSKAQVEANTKVIQNTHTTFDLPIPSLSTVVEADLEGYEYDPKERTTFWFHSDHLGSASYITNTHGFVSQHMEYLPFGELLVDEHLNSINSPFKFNGKMLDGETGNYYYGARYYDPKLSIFLSVDPLAEKAPGWTPYRYGFNNPIMYTDPTGMFEDDYEIDANGKITLLRTTNSENDRLLASNGDIIDDNVQKGILRENLDLGKNVNMIDMKHKNTNGDKIEMEEINDVLFRTSLYFQKEIAWGKFESHSDKEGWAVINPFMSNTDVAAIGVGSQFRRNNQLYTLAEDYHTHPSWSAGGGYPSGAGGDLSSLRHLPPGAKAFIISRQAHLTRYDKGVDNPFTPPMNKREQWITKEFVKNKWGWRKAF